LLLLKLVELMHTRLQETVVILVITEISSATLHANGYKNTAMPTTISSPKALKYISKGKNYTIRQKLTCANSPKEVHAQSATCTVQHSLECAKCATVYNKICTLL